MFSRLAVTPDTPAELPATVVPVEFHCNENAVAMKKEVAQRWISLHSLVAVVAEVDVDVVVDAVVVLGVFTNIGTTMATASNPNIKIALKMIVMT